MANRKVRMLLTNEQRKLTNNNEGKCSFQPVLVGCNLGQRRDAHQINANHPMIESLILGFDFAAADSLAQGRSMYDIDRGVRSRSGLLFFVADRRPIQFTS